MRRHIWTAEELDYLKEHHSDTCLQQMSIDMGLSASTISTKLHSLGYPLRRHTGNRRVWSEEEIRILRETFADEAAVDIGDRLGVSAPCVLAKARELGLRKSPSFNVYRYHGRYTNRYSGKKDSNVFV